MMRWTSAQAEHVISGVSRFLGSPERSSLLCRLRVLRCLGFANRCQLAPATLQVVGQFVPTTARTMPCTIGHIRVFCLAEHLGLLGGQRGLSLAQPIVTHRLVPAGVRPDRRLSSATRSSVTSPTSCASVTTRRNRALSVSRWRLRNSPIVRKSGVLSAACTRTAMSSRTRLAIQREAYALVQYAYQHQLHHHRRMVEGAAAQSVLVGGAQVELVGRVSDEVDHVPFTQPLLQLRREDQRLMRGVGVACFRVHELFFGATSIHFRSETISGTGS